MKKFFFIVMAQLVVYVTMACTTFTITNKEGHMAFGRNFDFPAGNGHIIINQKNLMKEAFVSPPAKAIQWVSKYGSITFNQMGRELPYGGMNEAGLVIEQMWMNDTQYPENDDRYTLTELQWIQYQLDNCATVKEVIATKERLRIDNKSVATLHFLVADASGEVATIEYIDGKMNVHRNENLPYTVLANCPYDRSINYKQTKEIDHDTVFNGWTENSSGRFVTAANMIEKYQQQNLVDYSFEILDAVAQGESTQWSIVYDITNKKIHLKTFENKTLRTIDFEAFDFTCNKTKSFCDIQENDLTPAHFKPHTYEANYQLIKTSCAQVDFLKNIPEEYMQASAAFPDRYTCRK